MLLEFDDEFEEEFPEELLDEFEELLLEELLDEFEELLLEEFEDELDAKRSGAGAFASVCTAGWAACSGPMRLASAADTTASAAPAAVSVNSGFIMSSSIPVVAKPAVMADMGKNGCAGMAIPPAASRWRQRTPRALRRYQPSSASVLRRMRSRVTASSSVSALISAARPRSARRNGSTCTSGVPRAMV